MTDKISIIISTFNAGKYIRKTLGSCLSQTYGNIEIIVIDDCSSDDTVSILSDYSDRIILVINKQNAGLSNNINKCVKMATGKYVLLLGHDDVLPENHVEQMLSEFSDSVSLVHCNSQKIDSNDNEIGIAVSDVAQQIKNFAPRIFLAVSNFIHSTGAIIDRKKFLEAGGWDCQFHNFGEWLLWIKLSNIGKIRYSKKSIAYYRRHDTNMTNGFKRPDVEEKLNLYFVACRSEAYSRLNSIEKVLVKIISFLLSFRRKYL